ncbi:MAG: hypothetical protein P8H36_01520 [Yoonia sp.]|jgi:hypothetical protein|nr:hypothetical protein [Yoonia sp.]MDG1520942.1 hypothetical protein [Yoonia sp.]MDG1768086.1 hypothetical protein [Yoonia sp.]MDG1867251.1 hypothetical protein [Yoonia sp.]
MIAFFQSLGVVGYFVVIVVVLGLWNLKKLIFLRSPLDSQQHKSWRRSGGIGKPDHLPHVDDKDPK